MLISESQESLLSIIERFNRKERYILFQQVTTRGEVQLTEAFRQDLRSLGWSVPDGGVLVLTDYHLNWLYAALEVHAGRWATSSHGAPRKLLGDVPPVLVKTLDIKPDEERFALENNQEDVDLLLVWEEGSTTHLGLIEAKAHSAWSNKQMASKAARLKAVLGDEGGRYVDVVPHFALMSFRKPTKLWIEGWPGWMTDDEGEVAHLDLAPPQKSRYSVGLVDRNGKSSSSGDGYGIRVAAKGIEE